MVEAALLLVVPPAIPAVLEAAHERLLVRLGTLGQVTRLAGPPRGLALTHNLGGYPGEMVSFVSVVGTELG